MGKVVERIVNAERVEDLITVFGSFDENIKRIEEALNVRVVNRGTDLRVSGDEEMADKAVRTLEGLLSLAAKGETIDEQRVRYLITLVNEGNDAQVAQDVVCITAKGKPIKAKTVGQQNYMKAIMKNTITIGVGPAGTGKTYLAVAAAVAAFRERTVNRIILTRPAVEAGERLGFLPGDLQNKVDPYLRPLYDALYAALVSAWLTKDALAASVPPPSTGKPRRRRSIRFSPAEYPRQPRQKVGVFPEREQVLNSRQARLVPCPLCRTPGAVESWYPQGDVFYGTFRCQEHGRFPVRMSVTRQKDGWQGRRVVPTLTEPERAAFAAAHQHEPFQCRREKAKRRKRHRKKGKGTE